MVELNRISSASRPGVLALASKALDLVLPRRCLACGAVVDSPGALCPGCWRGLSFVSAPFCRICGLPFELEPPGERPESTLCGRCLAAPPPFARARAALLYDEGSRPLILAFKHGDRTDAAPGLARLMASAGGELLEEAELIVPVPLHWRRLLARRYNQAGLLARVIARTGGRAYAPGLLTRRRATPSQAHKTARQRRRNLDGAFRVPGRGRERLKGRRILLIDDVMTSGATLESAARTLRAAGAGRVEALTLARVR